MKALHKIVPLFLKDLEVRGFAPRTCENYRYRMRLFLDYLTSCSISKFSELTQDVILGYQAHAHERRGLYGQRTTHNTQAHELAVVQRFCSFLVRRGLILADPSRDLELPRSERRLPRSILTTREAVRFLNAIDTKTALGVRDRAIFETLYSTAMRVGELVALTPGDMNLEEGYALIRRGKGGKARLVPLGRIAARWIQRYCQTVRAAASPDAPLFLSCRGRPMKRATLSILVRHWTRVAGLKKRITCHSWRHTCATHLLQRRASLRHIQELLGHEKLSTTQVYTRVSILDLKRVHRKYHPRGQ